MTASRGRRARTILIALVAVVVAIILVGLPLYVFPSTDTPRKTDVIMVLGPPQPSRIAIAQKLLGEGLSKNLIISVPPLTNRYDNATTITPCRGLPGVTVYCRTPNPFTTRGEAHILRSLSAKNHWTTATIITFTPHISRARFIVQRCFAGKLTMVADRTPLPLGTWVYQYLYQTGAFGKAFLEGGC